jgi:hypothetical protein
MNLKLDASFRKRGNFHFAWSTCVQASWCTKRDRLWLLLLHGFLCEQIQHGGARHARELQVYRLGHEQRHDVLW